MTGDAVISSCGQYRYVLSREIGSFGLDVVFVMLNPSTADATLNDPTIRRCMDFARQFGAKQLTVVNLFALRATDPKVLRSHPDPVGPENDKYIDAAISSADLSIAAWGTHGVLNGRESEVAGRYPNLRCLGITKDGHPKHPLYLHKQSKHAPFGLGMRP